MEPSRASSSGSSDAALEVPSSALLAGAATTSAKTISGEATARTKVLMRLAGLRRIWLPPKEKRWRVDRAAIMA